MLWGRPGHISFHSMRSAQWTIQNGKDWAKNAAKLAKKMGAEGELSPEEEKARIAADLANDVEEHRTGPKVW